MAEETSRPPDHPLTAIARGCAASVAGFGIAAAFVVTGVASAGGVAWIPALLFALVYLSWRPTGLALRPAGDDAPRDARTLVTAVPIDAFIVALGAYATFRVVVLALSA